MMCWNTYNITYIYLSELFFCFVGTSDTPSSQLHHASETVVVLLSNCTFLARMVSCMQSEVV